MAIVGAFIMPHPPVIIPEVGCGREQMAAKTVEACDEAAHKIADLKPDVIVLTSPHAVMYEDYFHISPGRFAHGGFDDFGITNVRFTAEYDEDFVAKLSAQADKYGLPAGTIGERSPFLDHGTMVPFYFINRIYGGYKLVRMGLSGLPLTEHYKLGQCIAEVAKNSGKRVVIIASGDLSHKLSEEGPYGYAPEGAMFDEQVTDVVSYGNLKQFLDFDPEFSEKAAECGLRSFVIMAGALDGMALTQSMLSYEAPFGIGYGVASFIPEFRDEYVVLAEYAIGYFLLNGEPPEIPDCLSDMLYHEKAGVFVSLKKDGMLRGCIGTIVPTTSCIAEEVIINAISAATQDPRFSPVEPAEYDRLSISVDVLSPSEPVDDVGMLDVQKYGVIVSKGHRRGLLLPNLDGVNTVSEQLSIALAKGGIDESEDYSIERFEVVRHV